MKLVWSPLASQDPEAIFDHIERDNPRAAARVDERIGREIERLATFPESGRPGRIPMTRELVIANTPFIAADIIEGGAIRILRVQHGARRWPDEAER